MTGQVPDNLLIDGPRNADACLVMAHGAGAPMDTPFMSAIARGLGVRELQTVRFEFAYMAERRETGKRRPPPRAEKLIEEYAAVVDRLAGDRPLVIGGKSMGSRVATLYAAENANTCPASGIVCLGYPFHPPGKPDRLRTTHLGAISMPVLICQGTRDPFGSRAEIEALDLPSILAFSWAEDGNHDLAPRKSSGRTQEDNWRHAIEAISGFVRRIV